MSVVMIRFALSILLVLISVHGWAAKVRPSPQVAILVNTLSPESMAIGQYYASRRKVPSGNIIKIAITPAEEVSRQYYHAYIREPVAMALRKSKFARVQYLVTTKGVPLHDDRGYSVDSLLTMALRGDDKEIENPYYRQERGFSRNSFGFTAVTRLDGYTVEDVKALIDRSIASPGIRGAWLFDVDSFQDSRDVYKELNKDLRDAAAITSGRGIPTYLEDSLAFAAGYSGLMGYFSWGSNDVHFNADGFVSNTFIPGAIAHTFVSTSARSFLPVTSGQSVITDLIAVGVTGVAGYTSEPYTNALCRVSVLADRYTRGFNLAESFYASCPAICWKYVIVGDPLCAPYATAPKKKK